MPCGYCGLPKLDTAACQRVRDNERPGAVFSPLLTHPGCPLTTKRKGSTMNPNCDGGRCASASGEVRLYPLGGGGNLILCRTCFAHENAYRVMRGKQAHNPDAWPVVDWNTAKPYPDAEESSDANRPA